MHAFWPKWDWHIFFPQKIKRVLRAPTIIALNKTKKSMDVQSRLQPVWQFDSNWVGLFWISVLFGQMHCCGKSLEATLSSLYFSSKRSDFLVIFNLVLSNSFPGFLKVSVGLWLFFDSFSVQFLHLATVRGMFFFFLNHLTLQMIRQWREKYCCHCLQPSVKQGGGSAL